jgi:hypothetical protein
MKHTIVILSALVFAFSSCKKDNAKENTTSPTTIGKYKSLAALNPEALALYNMYSSMDYEAAAIANSTMGYQNPRYPDQNFYLLAFTPFPNLTITLPTGKYIYSIVPADGKYEIKSTGGNLSSLFGTKVPMSISNGNDVATETKYIPTVIKAKKLGEDPKTMNINRTGNVLSWNSDANNTIGVVFHYTLYNQPVSGSGSIIETNSYVVDDNGSLNLDQFLSNPSAKSIDFEISRGNAINLPTQSKNTVFDIRSSDNHSYDIN